MDITIDDLQAAKEMGFQNHLARPGNGLDADSIVQLTSEVYQPLDQQRAVKLESIRNELLSGD